MSFNLRNLSFLKIGYVCALYYLLIEIDLVKPYLIIILALRLEHVRAY